MHLLGICGGRKDGNTAVLLRKVLESAEKDFSLIQLSGLDIKPCDGCWRCKGSGKCVIKDDMKLIYGELLRCDALILGSPVYFGNVSASLKTVMDRTVCFYNGKCLQDKLGAGVAVQGGDAGDLVLGAICKFYTYHNIIYVGGVVGEAYGKGAIYRDKEAIAEAEELGRRIGKLWKRMHR